MIEQLITHVNAMIAQNPALNTYFGYKRIIPMSGPDKTKPFPQITLDYYDTIPSNHKHGYSETMRVHLLVWHDNSPDAHVKASTASALISALMKNSSQGDVHFYNAGRESLDVDAASAKARVRIQLDLRS